MWCMGNGTKLKNEAMYEKNTKDKCLHYIEVLFVKKVVNLKFSQFTLLL